MLWNIGAYSSSWFRHAMKYYHVSLVRASSDTIKARVYVTSTVKYSASFDR